MIYLELGKARRFRGDLSFGADMTPVEFSANIDRKTGDVSIQIDELPCITETEFIRSASNQHTPYPYFSMTGKSDDGASFRTEYLSIYLDQFKDTLCFSRLECSKAMISVPAPDHDKPRLTYRLRGGIRMGACATSCHLGGIVFDFYSPTDSPGDISHSLTITAPENCNDVAAWLPNAQGLLDHIRVCMSFALGINLTTPIRECYLGGGEVGVEVYEQSEQAGTQLPVIGGSAHSAFLEAIIRAWPLGNDFNLWPAVAWFVLPSVYAEQRMVNAMTALETLIRSLLSDEETALLDPDSFKKFERSIKDHIKDNCFPSETEKLLRCRLYQKLQDFSRKSLNDRLKAVFDKLSVPMNFIDEKIPYAIKARDHLIHGIHIASGSEGTEAPGIFYHVTVIREIFARVIFCRIGYSGQYITYVNGARETTFPPTDMGT